MINLDKLKLKWYSSYKLNHYREAIARILGVKQSHKIIFIFGCQRSGTTIIQKIISLNPNVKHHGEGDTPYFKDISTEFHHRLKSSKEIEHFCKQETLEYIAIKPLYESQCADSLLSANPTSKAIWIYRNYLDVIDSHIHYYKQSSIEYIRPLFEYNKNHWLNEYIPDDVQCFIKQFKLDDLTDADAYGLFWIARNSLYWSVTKKSNIILVNYEKLVNKPTEEISRVCKFLRMPFHKFYSKTIRTNAVSKKVNFELNADIENKCKELYSRLNSECN